MNQNEPITMLESDLMDWLPLDREHAISLNHLANVLNTKQITAAFLLLALKRKGVPIAYSTGNRHHGFFILTN